MLYIAETDTGRIWAWDVLSPGELHKLPWPSPYGGRLAVGIGGYTRFDSLAVTSFGKICAAALESCCAIEAVQDGSNWRSHAIPDLQVTNIVFGGAGIGTAFLTLS